MNPIPGRHLKKYLLLGLLFCSSAAWTATTPLPFFDSKDLTPYWLTDKSAATRQPIVMTRPGAVQIYSFSVTPQKDSPERLREYARKHGISTRHWSLLTGDEIPGKGYRNFAGGFWIAKACARPFPMTLLLS